MQLIARRATEVIGAGRIAPGDDALRVLHGQSFIDDPTRVLRLARYRARLHFDVEAETARLARQALASSALP